MEKRKIIFGSYDTAINGPWVLTGWELSPAGYKANFVSVPGRDGDLDLSAVLTDGVPRYSDRTLTATFESSEGSRLDREGVINTMINWLDGWRMNIVIPDDPTHYLTGRVHVARVYNDPAHASVQVTAICDPWRYNQNETVVSLTASATEQTAMLTNSGRKTVVPLLNVSGESAAVNLAFGTASWALGAGTYQLPDMVVPQGGAPVKFSGSGALSFSYREAVL